MPGARASTPPPRPWPGAEPAAPPASARLPQGQQAGCLNPKHSSEGDSSKGGRRWTGGPGWQTGQTHGHSDSSPATRACPRVRAGQDQVRCSRSSQLHPRPYTKAPQKGGPSMRLPGSPPLLATCSLFPPPTSTKTLRDGEQNIHAPARKNHWLRPCSLLPSGTPGSRAD